MKICSVCDTRFGRIANITRISLDPPKEKTDVYCTTCGRKLITEILKICPKCNKPRRVLTQAFNPSLLDNDYVKYCHGCGLNYTEINE